MVEQHGDFRQLLACALVRWSTRWWDASYGAFCRVERGEMPQWWEKPWTWGAKRVERLALPVALRLDRDAASAQMAEGGWWG